MMMEMWTFRALKALIYKGSESKHRGTPYIYIKTPEIGVLTVHAKKKSSGNSKELPLGFILFVLENKSE